MTFGQGFIVVLGVALQTIIAAATGAPSLFVLYLLIIASLWGFTITVARSKNRSIGSWIWACFWFGPLIALVATLFYPRIEAHQPYGVPK